MQIEIIGYVRNSRTEINCYQSDQIIKECSEIHLNGKFEDGLFKIENFTDLNIIFYFHKSAGYELKTTTRSGDFRGVFATCSPFRPSLIGLTRVKLLECKGNILKVTGLDAINETPVLDIKPVINPELK